MTEEAEVRLCKQGHPMTEDNVTSAGRCRTCRRAQQVASRRRHQERQEAKNREEADIAEGRIDYLYLTPAQQRASDRLNYAVDRADEMGLLTGGLKCEQATVSYDKTRDRFVESYPHMDYDERTPPTAIEASRMCRDCPVLVECGMFAKSIRPSMGVWAGVTYVDGKPQTR